MTGSAKFRALVVCCALALCFTGFSYRLVQLQLTQHEEYMNLALEKHASKEIIHAQRGSITDANGELLAGNDPASVVVADCSLIQDPAEAAALLAGPLQVPEADLQDKLASGRKYVVLKRGVSEADAQQIENRVAVRSLRGITLEPDEDRIYPNGPMLCHVIGYTNGEHDGAAGIEKQMENYLRGNDGFRYTQRDRKGRELVAYRGAERLAENGDNVQLTVDLNLQNIVETALDEACGKYHPIKAVAILIRPQTGEILALANRPNYDPNEIHAHSANYSKSHTGDTDNPAISDRMEPGSTFKIVTVAAAFNERLVNPTDTLFCENGYYAKVHLHDDEPHGDLTINDVLVKSSNIGAAKLALKLGDQRFYEYIRRFGFGDVTGVLLPGEIKGEVDPADQWRGVDITRVAMGQGRVAVTPLQTVSAMCTIANGGHLMMPQIVRRITDEKGAVVSDYAPVAVRQVIDRQTDTEMVEALKGVVSERGTAAMARVPGFTVAGKTGTAQIVGPDGKYVVGKHVVSFCGFLPADNPAIVGIVILNQPQTAPGEDYGGTIAAPVFAEIAGKAARYLNLEPEQPAGNVMITQREHD